MRGRGPEHPRETSHRHVKPTARNPTVQGTVWVINMQIGRQMGRQIGRQIGSQIGRQIGRQMGRQMGSRMGRQMGRQIGKQISRQIGRRHARSHGTCGVAVTDRREAKDIRESQETLRGVDSTVVLYYLSITYSTRE